MATLKISELSVGDWVKASGMAKRVHNIEFQNGEYFVHFSDPDTNSEDYLHAPFIGPIPITTEVLEKNGFVRGQRGNFYHYLRLNKNRTLYIHASTNGWRAEITYDAAGILHTTHLMPDMNSVHQLQHAMRLAGVDKEINL